MKTIKLLRLGIILIVMVGSSLQAQLFQPMGTGININNYTRSSTIYENQGDVYVAYQELTYNPYKRRAHLYKWDGFTWSSYPAINKDRIRSIIMYKGDLYVAADYQFGAKGNLYKFNGGSWDSVFSNISGAITDMEIQNNKLICAGNFSIGTPASHGILAYDGTNLLPMPSLGATDSVADLNLIGNEIWVAGKFDQSNNQNDSVDVMKLTNGVLWERPAVAFENSTITPPWVISSIFEYSNKTYCGGHTGLYEIVNDTAYVVDNTYQVYEYAEFDGLMYLSNKWGGMNIFDGTNIAPLIGSPGQVFSLTSNSSNLFAFFGDTSKINGVDFGHVLQMGPQSYGMLQGKVYADENANCAFDAGTDNPLLYTILHMLGVQNSYVGANSQGNYSAYVPAGNYSLQPPTNPVYGRKYYSLSCGTNLNFSITAGQTTQKDVIFAHDGSIDVASSVFMFLGNRSRQGFTENGRLVIRNPGAAINSPVSFKLTLPASVTFVSSSIPPSSTSGNEYTFTLPSLAQSSIVPINFKVKIDLATNNVGDTLKFYSEVGPLPGDVDLTNDKDTTWTRVVAACDPNDKTPSVDQSLPGISRLDYHIRFQNTGTDTAYNVKIVDTLESYFDPASITINGASHDYSFHIADNHVIAWTFDDIRLPDSAASMEGSQGYVNFSIDVDPTLQVGDIIDNDAEIYFDFQPPVHTNHAQTAIVSVLGVEEYLERQTSLKVYPNPAHGLFYIDNSLNEKQEVKLIDATGKVIRNISLQPEMKAEVGTRNLAPGMYFINNGSNTHRVIITP